jgi:L-ascorbate metabolism protein UlaG (beta-lactamase superfamily)
VNESRIAGLRRERTLASTRFEGGRFRNTLGITASLDGPALPLLGEYFFGGAARTPARPLPKDDPRSIWSRPPETGLRTTWLGHSTVLLEIDGARVLTDPVFGMRASPTSFAGPKRFQPAPVAIADLPPIDLVLLSHDHYDHLCRASIVEIARRGTPVVTALGVGAHLEAFGIPAHQITELEWGESARLGPVRITATPAQHFSGRGLLDRNRTLWASWVLEGERHRVFFSGDTGLTPEFETIGREHGPFDLVLLEIGAFHPAWKHIHLGPENALEAFRMLGGGTLLPVHWGTFNLALHAWDEPAETLLTRADERSMRVITPSLGLAVEPSRVERASPWWRDVSLRSRRNPTPR